MSDDDRTPAWQRFDEVLDGIVAEAVEAEKERAAAIVNRRLKQLGYGEGRWFDVLNEIRSGFVAPEPEPPAAEPKYEPATIAGVLTRLKATFAFAGVPDGFDDWTGVKADLTALVDATKKRIRCSEPKPEPAAEPMTVAKLFQKWTVYGACIWQKPAALEADLQELVREQARLDAKMCTDLAYRRAANEWTSACHQCGTNICDAAGLQ